MKGRVKPAVSFADGWPGKEYPYITWLLTPLLGPLSKIS